MPRGAFVFTSNVDGHFQRAGFDADQVMEVHGSLDYLQCSGCCGIGIFPADETQVVVEEESMRAREPLPACPGCACLARPNVLMFGDWGWDDARTSGQRQRLEDWLQSACTRRLVLIECGAGTAIPTVRRFCEEIALQSGGLLVRINVREPEVPEGHVSLPLGALESLRRIDELLTKKRSSD